MKVNYINLIILKYQFNRKPSIRFQRNKYVLTKADKMTVPFKVVNTDKVDIKVFKIPGELVNEIRDYDYEYSDYGLNSLINSKGTNDTR